MKHYHPRAVDCGLVRDLVNDNLRTLGVRLNYYVGIFGRPRCLLAR